jgi:cytoskeleton protein RodZ
MTAKEPSNLGELLASARTHAGLSVANIADKLRLTVNLIEKIDANQFEATGLAPIFLRGYIRSYARLVGIPDTITSQALTHEGLDEKEQSAPAQEALVTPNASTIMSNAKRAKIITYFAVILILLLLALYWHHRTRPALDLPATKITTRKPAPLAVATLTPSHSDSKKASITPSHSASKKTAVTPRHSASKNATIAAALPEQGMQDEILEDKSE